MDDYFFDRSANRRGVGIWRHRGHSGHNCEGMFFHLHRFLSRLFDPTQGVVMNPIPRILIVEDDPTVRELSAKLLNRSGYEVDTAVDGEAGLKTFHAASDNSSSYDL